MHCVPRHDRGVALREFIVKTCALAVDLIAVRRPRPRFADPAAIGLRRDGVTQMVHRKPGGHGDVLDAILVAGDDGPADLAVKDRLAPVVQLAAHRIEAFDQHPADAALLAEPKRRADDQDVGGQDLFPDRGPIIAVPAVLGHVGVDARWHLMVEQVEVFDAHPLRLHNARARVHQKLRMAVTRCLLERAVHIERLEVGKVSHRQVPS